MSYLITGATGFIGSALAIKLADDGHKVNALVRSRNKSSILEHKNITLYFGSLEDEEILKKSMEGTDGVFHLAAFAQPYARDKTIYNRTNAKAAARIFKIAQEMSVKRVVFTSTAGTFGPSGKIPVDENTIRLTDFLNEYESTKFMAEKIAKDWVISGMDIVTVHPTRVYGPGLLSKSNAVTLMIKRYIQGLWRIIPGDGKKLGNYVFIDDVVQGHILAMIKGKAGKQYFLGGENCSYNNFFKQLRNVSHKKFILVKIPVWILIIFATIQMQLALLLGQNPLLPPKWVNKYLYNWEVSSKKASTELGYQITPLKEGFEKTIQWLKNKKK